MSGGTGFGNPFGSKTPGGGAEFPMDRNNNPFGQSSLPTTNNEDDLDEEEEDHLESFVDDPISKRIPSESLLKKRVPIARLPRHHLKDIIKFAIDHEEKYVFFVTDDIRCIYRAAIAHGGNDFSRPPAAEVIYQAFEQKAPRVRNSIFGGSFRAEEISMWVEKSSNQLVVASRRLLARLSKDFNSFESIGWPAVDIDPGSLFQASSGRILGNSQSSISELVLSGSQITVQQIAPLPPIKVYPFHFDQALDGTLYLSTCNSILRFSPEAAKWEAFAGQGQKVPDGSDQRLSGAPLTADIEHSPVIACDALSNVLVFNPGCYRGRHYHNQLWHYMFKDGKRFETIGLGSDVYNNSGWISKWVSYVKVEFDVPQPPPNMNLSKLWTSHPEVADFTIQCSFGQIYLHKCILSVRWPHALESLEAEGKLPFVPPNLLQLILQYVYDEYLPDASDEFSPFQWVELARVAKSLQLDDLRERCKSGFQKSLWFADPELSMLGVKAAADCDESELVEIAKPLLVKRPEIVLDRAHKLRSHPDLMAALLNGMAAEATRSRGQFVEVVGPDFALMEKPSFLGNCLLQLLDGGGGALCDMQFQSIPCHQAIMLARFPFVEMALSSGFKESKEKHVMLSDATKSPEAIKRLLAFIYSNEASTRIIGSDPDICGQILDLVDFLQLTSQSELIKHCKRIRNLEESSDASESDDW